MTGDYYPINPTEGPSDKVYIMRPDGSWCFTFDALDRLGIEHALKRLNSKTALWK